jgi:hypothetical protein
MKRSFSFFKPGVVAMACVLLFSACKKNNEAQSIPVAGVMAFNLAADKGPVIFTLSGNSLTQVPLSYSLFTGSYLNIYPGIRTVASYDQVSRLDSGSYTFEVNKYYSLFLVGANGSYKNLVVADNIDTLNASNGMAYIRYINAVADSSKPAVTITANGSTLFSGQSSFATVSAFRAVQPGEVSISMNNDGNINTSRTITVEAQKVYTVLLQGMAGQTDQDKAVQIKFISNGRIVP